ncbi:MAG: N-acetyltransferase [Gemmataceae bacterium]|nr:N-acetyltransferase [Gemmataceae bacterium]
MLVIRFERPTDAEGIHAVHAAAFPASDEARLVAALRAAGRLTVALAALAGERVVGHVAFSPVSIADSSGGVGLAPVAVLPEVQRQGIGSRLIRDGLAAAREAGCGFVVVLGDPRYYGRFGFVPARRWNLHDEYGGGDAFQALELCPGSIPAGGGLVRYAPEFAALGDGHE